MANEKEQSGLGRWDEQEGRRREGEGCGERSTARRSGEQGGLSKEIRERGGMGEGVNLHLAGYDEQFAG